jgi:hypothetical protein
VLAVCEASSTAQLPDSNPTSVPQPVCPTFADLLCTQWLKLLEILPPHILLTCYRALRQSHAFKEPRKIER